MPGRREGKVRIFHGKKGQTAAEAEEGKKKLADKTRRYQERAAAQQKGNGDGAKAQKKLRPKLHKAARGLAKHEAISRGLSMEEDGTVLVDAVLRLPEWTGLTLADLLEIVDRSPNQPFSVRGGPQNKGGAGDGEQCAPSGGGDIDIELPYRIAATRGHTIGTVKCPLAAAIRTHTGGDEAASVDRHGDGAGAAADRDESHVTSTNGTVDDGPKKLAKSKRRKGASSAGGGGGDSDMDGLDIGGNVEALHEPDLEEMWPDDADHRKKGKQAKKKKKMKGRKGGGGGGGFDSDDEVAPGDDVCVAAAVAASVTEPAEGWLDEDARLAAQHKRDKKAAKKEKKAKKKGKGGADSTVQDATGQEDDDSPSAPFEPAMTPPPQPIVVSLPQTMPSPETVPPASAPPMASPAPPTAPRTPAAALSPPVPSPPLSPSGATVTDLAPATLAVSDVDEDAGSAAEDWEDLDEPWEPRYNESLFDGRISASLETNMDYMWKAHGFLVPSASSVVDPMGLFAYLQEKICRFNTCLKCNRPFDSLEAVRMHMRDVSHCRVNCDDEDGALELSRFYTAKTAGSAAETAAAFTLMVHGSAGEAAMCPDTGELVLPSGARLGHRSLQKYYKQSYNTQLRETMARRAAIKGLVGKAAMREANKKQHMVLLAGHARAKGNSKAIASNYVFKEDFADNAARRAIKHHWGEGGGGAHYTMCGSRQYQKGVRVKGVVLRHSKQGAKLQSARSAVRNKQNRGNSSIAVLQGKGKKS